jgi:hypothetical protein
LETGSSYGIWIFNTSEMKTLLILLFVLAGISSYAQKKELIENKDSIVARAAAELDQAMQGPEGRIYLFAQEHGIKGSYTMDISIQEKGKVSSIFAVDHENGTIDFQNRLKDFIMEYKFNFKMPKGKYYKFRYTFNFG